MAWSASNIKMGESWIKELIKLEKLQELDRGHFSFACDYDFEILKKLEAFMSKISLRTPILLGFEFQGTVERLRPRKITVYDNDKLVNVYDQPDRGGLSFICKEIEFNGLSNFYKININVQGDNVDIVNSNIDLNSLLNNLHSIEADKKINISITNCILQPQTIKLYHPNEYTIPIILKGCKDVEGRPLPDGIYDPLTQI